MTPKLLAVLDFLRSYIAEHGYSPSYDDICAAVGWKSKSNAVRVVDSLVEQGRVRRIPHRARALEVLETLPGVATPSERLAIAARAVANYKAKAKERAEQGTALTWADLADSIVAALP
jgi:SOS-response transcriptional repressor LexA